MSKHVDVEVTVISGVETKGTISVDWDEYEQWLAGTPHVDYLLIDFIQQTPGIEPEFADIVNRGIGDGSAQWLDHEIDEVEVV